MLGSRRFGARVNWYLDVEECCSNSGGVFLTASSRCSRSFHKAAAGVSREPSPTKAALQFPMPL